MVKVRVNVRVLDRVELEFRFRQYRLWLRSSPSIELFPQHRAKEMQILALSTAAENWLRLGLG